MVKSVAWISSGRWWSSWAVPLRMLGDDAPAEGVLTGGMGVVARVLRLGHVLDEVYDLAEGTEEQRGVPLPVLGSRLDERP